MEKKSIGNRRIGKWEWGTTETKRRKGKVIKETQRPFKFQF